ncbi:hypothetical protein BU17DRAFT_63136 [Hysterangium stoloniferum]|nr:hypothetical protein BU17DRAFT_63136 [Hysterangium stoloniferum]
MVASDKSTMQPPNVDNKKPPERSPTEHHVAHNPKIYMGPVHPLFGTFLTFSLGVALYALRPDESDPRDVIAVLSMLGNVLWLAAGVSLLVYPRFFRCDDKSTMWACYFFEIVKLTTITTKVLTAALGGRPLSLDAIRSSTARLTSSVGTFIGGMALFYITVTFYIYAMVSVYMDILAFYHLVGDETTAGWSNTHAQLERNLRAIVPFSTRMYTRARKAGDQLNEADRACTLICPCSCHRHDDHTHEQSTESEAAQIVARATAIKNGKDRIPTEAENLGPSDIQGGECIDQGASSLTLGWEGRVQDSENIAEDTEDKDNLVAD